MPSVLTMHLAITSCIDLGYIIDMFKHWLVSNTFSKMAFHMQRHSAKKTEVVMSIRSKYLYLSIYMPDHILVQIWCIGHAVKQIYLFLGKDVAQTGDTQINRSCIGYDESVFNVCLLFCSSYYSKLAQYGTFNSLLPWWHRKYCHILIFKWIFPGKVFAFGFNDNDISSYKSNCR